MDSSCRQYLAEGNTPRDAAYTNVKMVGLASNKGVFCKTVSANNGRFGFLDVDNLQVGNIDAGNLQVVNIQVDELEAYVRLTVPPVDTVPGTPIQKKGSLIFDCESSALYYSDGTQWFQVIASLNGNVLCISDNNFDTMVCTDNSLEENTDTIYFKTFGTDRAIINKDGVFVATAGNVDPSSIVLTPGKVAHFEGHINVTGVVDPMGVQFTPQVSAPAGNNMLYVDTMVAGNFSNPLTYVDSNGPHVMGDTLAPTAGVVDHALPRYDGTSGTQLQGSGVTLSDGRVFDSGASSMGVTAGTSLGLTAGTSMAVASTSGMSLTNSSGALSVTNTNGEMTVTNNSGNITLSTPMANTSTIVSGNLHVTGTTVTTNTETLNVMDNCIFVNNGYIGTAGLSGCMVVNYKATNNIATVAGAGFTNAANSTVGKSGFTFSAGDLVQVSSANNHANDGLYEVMSSNAGSITIRGVWCQNSRFCTGHIRLRLNSSRANYTSKYLCDGY